MFPSVDVSPRILVASPNMVSPGLFFARHGQAECRLIGAYQGPMTGDLQLISFHFYALSFFFHRERDLNVGECSDK